MSELKIILLCSTRFALPALREMAFFKLLAAVAIPRHCDELIENVDVILANTGIPVIELDNETFDERLREAMEENEINMGLVMTFPYKIPSSVYNLPVHGFYNVHSGPLPQYRGADPVFQQIKNRERQAGVTVHKLDDGMDTGAVVMGEMLKIEPWDTHGLLTTKLANLGAKLTATIIKLISFDIAIPSRLQDEMKARYFNRQKTEDIIIKWQTMNADTIIALINACNPWNKGAVAKMNGQVIRLLDAEMLPGHSSQYKEPGYIIFIEENGMTVSTIHGQAINVRMVYAEEGFLRPCRLNNLGVAPGLRFEMI